MGIMLVGSDLVYLELLSEVLQLHGYDVTMAHDGEEALVKLRGAPVDVVLSDINMPEMNGENLHRHLREDPKLKQLPFAWNSGHCELNDVAEVVDPDIDLKFDKTMPVPNLLFFLSHFANGRRHRSKGQKRIAC